MCVCVCGVVSAELLFQQVPLLRIDGMNLVQSGAIARYLARKAHLYGDTDLEAGKYVLVSSANDSDNDDDDDE